MMRNKRKVFFVNFLVFVIVVISGHDSTLSGQIVPQVPRGNALRPDITRAQRHYELGWKLFHHEDWQGAVKEFQQAIQVYPSFAEAYYSLGRAEMAQRHFVNAIDAYLKCRETYVANAGQSVDNQVNGTRRLEDLILEQKMALQQLQNGSMKSLGQTSQLAAREIQTKISQLEFARDRNQNIMLDTSVPFYVPLSLGAAYFRSNKFEDAEREFKAAIEANSKSGEAHSNLAVLYMTVGRLDEAAAEITLAEKTGFKVNPGLKDDLAAKRALLKY
jgi:tetratricopeptide (TPR) repeat protein